ncbi:Rieske (2Fe-2S) protein [Pseudomonadales bacterium]|nr:Rieske (2Fe-2S) protein [Pseudomonadales bacterium]
MTRLCHINDIDEGASMGFEIADKKLFAVKKDAAIHVYENRCPHLGIELEWLENQFLDPDGALIQCSTHGALFLIEDGNCISGPCAGEQLRRIETVVQADEIFLTDEFSAD